VTPAQIAVTAFGAVAIVSVLGDFL